MKTHISYTPYRFHDYQLVITAPDGTNTTQSFPIIYDTTSAQDYAFTPDTVGTYKVTFIFPGQTVTASDAAPGDAFINDTYMPSTASTTLTVQSSPIRSSHSKRTTTNGLLDSTNIRRKHQLVHPLVKLAGTTWPGYAAWEPLLQITIIPRRRSRITDKPRHVD